MLIRKSYFLWEEHGRMEQEAAMLRQVDEIERQLESTRHKSQDWAAEVMGARAAKLLVAKWVIAAERGLDAAKVHLAKTKVVLQKSLEALETERRA